jgi:hypothetical protein
MIERGWWGAQLNPEFVEWMMGLTPGWVTDCPGLSRNDMLSILGNGVVPLQAAAGITACLDNLGAALAALTEAKEPDYAAT